MSSATKLTLHDASILSALFDAESAPSSSNIVHIDNTLPSDPHYPSSTLEALQTAELAAIKPLNTPSPTSAAIHSCIDALTSLISTYPLYASAYVNRAQALRLQLPAQALFTGTEPHSHTTALLLSDLRTAISLATPRTPNTPFSPSHTRILAAAHTHRGYLLMHAANVAGSASTNTLGDTEAVPEELRGLSKEQLEEMASKDFALGGRYGDRDARGMAVRTNPYAKMCGAVVKEAMREEMRDAAGMGVSVGVRV